MKENKEEKLTIFECMQESMQALLRDDRETADRFLAMVERTFLITGEKVLPADTIVSIRKEGLN